VGWSDDTVWLDAAKTMAKTTYREHYRATAPGQCGFHGVSEKVWEFQIGSFQVCHKWLHDRRGRTLSDEDIRHYQKILMVISETLCIMPKIDEIIKRHGGWPGAFHNGIEDR